MSEQGMIKVEVCCGTTCYLLGAQSLLALEKSMPVFIGEFGVPYVGSFFTMTDFNFSGQPYFLENGAQVLGDASYAFSAPYSMKAFHAYGKDGIHRHISEKRSTHPGNYDHQPPMLDKIGNSYFHSIFMAWRLLGVNGLGAFGYSEGSTVNHHGGYGRWNWTVFICKTLSKSFL